MGTHNAASDVDYIGYFSADIGTTRTLSASVALAQGSDAEGALPPGRYMVVARDFSDPTALAWVHVGPFVAGTPLAPSTPTAAGPQRIPLNDGGFVEYVAIKGHNDRLAVQLSAGTATIYLTKISRGLNA